MSALGLGTDIVAVARIAAVLNRHGERFLTRCFAPRERDWIAARPPPTAAESVAGRWAAKEACLKALGGDVRSIPYRDVEVVRDPAGPVKLHLHGRAAEMWRDRGGGRLHLTISHERAYAVATVLIES